MIDEVKNILKGNILLLLILMVPCFSLAQRAPVKIIRGQITDSLTGKPLANIGITLKCLVGKNEEIIRTDKKGHFKCRISNHHIWNMEIKSGDYEDIVLSGINGGLYKFPLEIKLKKK